MSKDHILERLVNVFAIDYRSLAVLRVGLGMALLYTAVQFYTSDLFHAFISEDGFLTNDYVLKGKRTGTWSLYFINDDTWYSALLLTLTGVSALALIVGYKTRLATFLCWVLFVSLSNRAPILLSGADTQLVVLLFWSMFLPLGARWSIDGGLGKQPDQEKHVSLATAAIILQVAYLYIYSGLYKTGSQWFPDGTAIYYALNALELSSPLAPFLAHFFGLTRWLTYYVYFLEIFAVFFLLSPFYTDRFRYAVLPQLLLLHISFILFLSVGFFPLVSLTGLMVFMPSQFWDWISCKTETEKRMGIEIWYDKDCDFCRKVCRIFREFSLPRQTPIRPAQEDLTAGKILQEQGTWVVSTANGQYYTHWNAVAFVWRRSPILWPLGILFLPKWAMDFGNKLYAVIAKYRRQLGYLSAVFLKENNRAVTFQQENATNVFLAICMACVFAWNLSDLPHVVQSKYAYNVGDTVRTFMRTVRLTQQWNMFAPYPLSLRRWHVIEGTLKNGEKVDLYWNKVASPKHDEPWSGYTAERNDRWRKFFINATTSDWEYPESLMSSLFGQYLCQRWQEEHFAQPALKTVSVYRYWYHTPPPGMSNPVARQAELLSHQCQPSNKRALILLQKVDYS